ncbi:MAG: hypothetical protein Q4C77_03000 [Eubacteriales bacterium]|nr:hypothetical protein [Eubacteriales bacterium]
MKKLILFTHPPKKSQYNVLSHKLQGNLRKTACITSLAVCLVLTACSTTSANSELEKSTEYSANTSAETDIALHSDIEGRILSVCPSALITVSEEDPSLSVDLTDCYDSSNVSYVEKMVHDCAYLIGTSKFDEKYSGISFSYMGENLSCIIAITDYKNISDYASNLICLDGKSTHITAMQILYEALFYNHTIENRQLIAQGEIAKKYGVNGGDATAEPEKEDDLWFYHSFNDALPHKLSGSSYVINYRYDMDDKYGYGQSVGQDINNAANNLVKYINNNPELLSFDNFLIICFDGDSDSRLLEYQLAETDNGSWSVTLYNAFNDDFKKGLESIVNN